MTQSYKQGVTDKPFWWNGRHAVFKNPFRKKKSRFKSGEGYQHRKEVYMRYDKNTGDFPKLGDKVKAVHVPDECEQYVGHVTGFASFGGSMPIVTLQAPHLCEDSTVVFPAQVLVKLPPDEPSTDLFDGYTPPSSTLGKFELKASRENDEGGIDYIIDVDEKTHSLLTNEGFLYLMIKGVFGVTNKDVMKLLEEVKLLEEAKQPNETEVPRKKETRKFDIDCPSGHRMRNGNPVKIISYDPSKGDLPLKVEGLSMFSDHKITVLYTAEGCWNTDGSESPFDLVNAE